MATTPTFDANGLRTLTLTEIITNMKEAVASASDLGPDVSTGAHTITGMILESVADGIELCYRLIDDIWAGGSPDGATGVQEDNILRLRGVVRNPARFSTATVSCGGVNGTIIAAGSISAIPNGGARWIHDAAITIVGGSTDVAVTAEDSGAVEAAVGAITEIVSAVAGWNTVTNAAEATLGEDIETDPDYRLRSEDATTGSTTEEALYTRISELDDVDAVVVTSNRTDAVDANGTDPHEIWIVIYPSSADQDDIAAAIWGEAGAAGGIGFRGAVAATVTDINGGNVQIAWDWATAVDTWISIVGTKDSDYPIDGDDLIEDNVTAYFATTRVGQDTYPAPIESACVGGILDVVSAVPGIKTIAALMKVGGAPGGGDVGPLTVALNAYADLNATIGVTMT